MATYAVINNENVVTNIVVADTPLEASWIKSLAASIGDIYDPTDGTFKPRRPFESWEFNEETWSWEAPTPMPEDDAYYFWNEENLAWEQPQIIEPTPEAPIEEEPNA